MDRKRVANVDYGLAAMSLLDGALRMIMPNPSARERLGLKGVSEKLCEPLGWYLWLKNAGGVYALELSEAGADGTGCFVMRFFPFATGNYFSCLSEEERQIRKSELFDATGAPVQNTGRILDPELFAVGVLTLARPTGGDNALEIILTSMSGWTQAVSWQLFDVLTIALCHHYRLSALQGESFPAGDEQPWGVRCVLVQNGDESPRTSATQTLSTQERPDPWLNQLWWRPESLGISLRDVEYPE